MTAAPEVTPVTRLIDQDRVVRYAAAARDPNPIHTDAEFAAARGLERPIASAGELLGELHAGRFHAVHRTPAGRVVRFEAGSLEAAAEPAAASPGLRGADGRG